MSIVFWVNIIGVVVMNCLVSLDISMFKALMLNNVVICKKIVYHT
jgi:hypothetical protein